ncbi:Alpha-ketoglutarate-dependent dioxygenase abh1 [Drechslerella dactyloides]|uniref:Alpha-ketoglutarate-dependent dioxygenase abh1 n=1 Tax=Drechslerella dactyloides TaxID=74499 RepID=A0AAD6IPV0_DREDA|nr:Alpha-ketoglutarate-dependent dioxygenase abh1 [Drechslerella dactyloides]
MNQKNVEMDAHAAAPPSVRRLYRHYNKLPPGSLPPSQVLDFGDANVDASGDGLRVVDRLPRDRLNAVYAAFLDGTSGSRDGDCTKDVKVYEHASIPGLRVLPGLLPPVVQRALLSRLLLRDLSNPAHKTNIHLHYSVPPIDPPSSSFFDLPPSTVFAPHDPLVHKPLVLRDVLCKKLRWMTLGGQYNWTTKRYPDTPPVPFPKDIKDLVRGIFPSIDPQAAICNAYSPGDALAPHRDVSEAADTDLISLSIGCDALFLISLSPNDAVVAEDPPPDQSLTGQSSNQPSQKRRRKKVEMGPPPPLDEYTLVIKIRSGDALVMGGDSRWAWHGVPQVLPDTCPEYLSEWPSPDSSWAGWTGGKRVNLNVRQMFPRPDP